MKWKKIAFGFRWEEIVAIATIIGIASLFLWIIIHP